MEALLFGQSNQPWTRDDRNLVAEALDYFACDAVRDMLAAENPQQERKVANQLAEAIAARCAERHAGFNRGPGAVQMHLGPILVSYMNEKHRNEACRSEQAHREALDRIRKATAQAHREELKRVKEQNEQALKQLQEEKEKEVSKLRAENARVLQEWQQAVRTKDENLQKVLNEKEGIRQAKNKAEEELRRLEHILADSSTRQAKDLKRLETDIQQKTQEMKKLDKALEAATAQMQAAEEQNKKLEKEALDFHKEAEQWRDREEELQRELQQLTQALAEQQEENEQLQHESSKAVKEVTAQMLEAQDQPQDHQTQLAVLGQPAAHYGQVMLPHHHAAAQWASMGFYNSWPPFTFVQPVVHQTVVNNYYGRRSHRHRSRSERR